METLENIDARDAKTLLTSLPGKRFAGEEAPWSPVWLILVSLFRKRILCYRLSTQVRAIFL